VSKSRALQRSNFTSESAHEVSLLNLLEISVQWPRLAVYNCGKIWEKAAFHEKPGHSLGRAILQGASLRLWSARRAKAQGSLIANGPPGRHGIGHLSPVATGRQSKTTRFETALPCTASKHQRNLSLTPQLYGLSPCSLSIYL
jgi:hypothetical protein